MITLELFMSLRKRSARRIGHRTCKLTSPRPRLLMRSMQRAHYSIPGFGVVRCTLWCLIPLPRRPHCPPAYAVGMEGPGGRRLMTLGSNQAKARARYALLVRHTVTPCALRDVLEEWRG